MRIFLFFILFSIAKIGLAGDMLDRLAGLLNAFTTYQANFTQQVFDSSGSKISESQGQVLVSRPGHFRWETNEPSKQIIIANGEVLWIYDIDLQQVTKQKLANQGISPAVLLTKNIRDLQDQFNVNKQGDWFILKPKNPEENSFNQVAMQFKQNHLVAMKIINTMGESNLFRFQNIRVNNPINEKLFQFSPPAGVDVLTD